MAISLRHNDIHQRTVASSSSSPQKPPLYWNYIPDCALSEARIITEWVIGPSGSGVNCHQHACTALRSRQPDNAMSAVYAAAGTALQMVVRDKQLTRGFVGVYVVGGTLRSVGDAVEVVQVEGFYGGSVLFSVVGGC